MSTGVGGRINISSDARSLVQRRYCGRFPDLYGERQAPKNDGVLGHETRLVALIVLPAGLLMYLGYIMKPRGRFPLSDWGS